VPEVVSQVIPPMNTNTSSEILPVVASENVEVNDKNEVCVINLSS
jgi:hypothetical protein